MATTSQDFLAFPIVEGTPTGYQFTVGFFTETYTSTGTGDALTLATEIADWFADAGRTWAPKTMAVSWAAGTAGARCTIAASANFDLTISGTNPLHLPGALGSDSCTSNADCDGTWIATRMILPPLWARVGEGSTPRGLSLGGALRADQSHGTTVKAATLQAFCTARQAMRLTDLIADCIGLAPTLTYVAESGAETELAWELPDAIRLDAVCTVTIPIRQEV